VLREALKKAEHTAGCKEIEANHLKKMCTELAE